MSDLYNLHGKFLSYEKFSELNIKTNFNEYCGINYKKEVTSRTKYIAIVYKAFVPHIFYLFFLNEKECKYVYQLLVYTCKQVITAVTKLQANGNIFFLQKIHGVAYLNCLLKLHRKTNIRWFQFQILHRIFPTNLFKLNILNSS